MARIIVFVTFCIIIKSSVFSQEYIPIDTIRLRCLYLYEFQQDSASKYSVKSQEMTLQIGNNTSKFTASHKIFSDSVILEHSKEKLTQNIFDKIKRITSGTIIHSYCKHYIYKNYPKKGMLTFTSYFDRKYPRVIENVSFNWNLKANSDTIILGYKCQKAYTKYAGRDYVAWYTTDIPISDGPHKFQGLPGLIVKIHDLKKHHHFELIKVETARNVQPILFKKNRFIDMTTSEYAYALNFHMTQLFNKIQQEEEVIIKDDETKARALNNIKTRNNFIEKY